MTAEANGSGSAWTADPDNNRFSPARGPGGADIIINPIDWITDVDLRMCSLAARGLLVELRIWSQVNPRRALTLQEMEHLFGEEWHDIERWLGELATAGIIELDDQGRPQMPVAVFGATGA